MRTTSLEQLPTRVKGVWVEPHPAHTKEVKPDKDGNQQWDVRQWRIWCETCETHGLGWKAQTSAMAQATDHHDRYHAQ